MNLIAIIDSSSNNWKRTEQPEKLLSMIMFHFNCLLTIDYNRIFVVCNKKIIFDSSVHPLFFIPKKLKKFSSEDIVGDLAVSLLIIKKYNLEAKILVVDLSEQLDSFRLLRCLFTANNIGVQINVYSANELLKTVASNTEGIFYEDDTFFVKLIGNQEKQLVGGETFCVCHNRAVLVGLTCPVCLAVYCMVVPICKRCKSRMSFLKNDTL